MRTKYRPLGQSPIRMRTEPGASRCPRQARATGGAIGLAVVFASWVPLPLRKERTSRSRWRASVAMETRAVWPGVYLGPSDTSPRWMRTTGAVPSTGSSGCPRAGRADAARARPRQRGPPPARARPRPRRPGPRELPRGKLSLHSPRLRTPYNPLIEGTPAAPILRRSMRRLVWITVLAFLLAAPAAGFAVTGDDDGTLSVKAGIGKVYLNFTGSAVGRAHNGVIRVTDPVAGDGLGFDFSGCDLEIDKSDTTARS